MKTLRIAGGGQQELRVGYLLTCGMEGLAPAFSHFTDLHPDTQIHVETGNHEELFQRLQNNQLDIAINDQRRAFSDAYMNFELAKANIFVQINRKNHLSALDTITPEDLKKVPCILVATKEQQQTEKEYYKTMYGIGEEVLYAENVEEAKILVAGNRGYYLTESSRDEKPSNDYVKNIPLVRDGVQTKKLYCAFWKKENNSEQLEAFAELLKEAFTK